MKIIITEDKKVGQRHKIILKKDEELDKNIVRGSLLMAYFDELVDIDCPVNTAKVYTIKQINDCYSKLLEIKKNKESKL